MDFYEVVAQVLELLQRHGRVSYRALKRQLSIDDAYIEDLKEEVIHAQRLAVDEGNRVLVWVGDKDSAQPIPPATFLTEPTSPPPIEPQPAPISYMPQYLTEKILTSKSSLEGERKVVTVLFADIKDSMEVSYTSSGISCHAMPDEIYCLYVKRIVRATS